MRSFVEFRKTEFTEILFRANVNGRGLNHCDSIADQYGIDNGLNYRTQYWNANDKCHPTINKYGVLK